MRIACVLIDHFAAAVSERLRPDLADLPFVVGGSPHERKPVYDVSPAAAGYGVVPGMTLREASQRCPQAVFLPLDEAAYARAFAGVLDALAVFTDAVEAETPGCAYLDLRRLPLPTGGEPRLAVELAAAVEAATGLSSRVGLASGFFVARVAAERAGPERAQVVAPGQERALLAPLPVATLPLSPEARRRLRLLGLTTVGALAALPAEAVAAQLGAEGATAHRLANGRDAEARRIKPLSRERAVTEERVFEEPLDDEAHLGLAVDHLVDQLLPGLQREYLFCQQAEVTLRLAGGNDRDQTLTAHLREPSQDGRTIARVVKQLVTTKAERGGITALRLTLAGLGGPESKQLSLFAPRQGRLERLAEAAAGLRARFGEGHLCRAVVTDGAAILPERRFGFVEYR